eukprot:COSAG06_NODE_316_length_17668_cov_19.142410_6_plen_81_part_00
MPGCIQISTRQPIRRGGDTLSLHAEVFLQLLRLAQDSAKGLQLMCIAAASSPTCPAVQASGVTGVTHPCITGLLTQTDRL